MVDDTAALRLLIRINLELDGFDVVEAVDGQDALDQLASCPDDDLPDVVTLDVVMPRLDGFSAAARMRETPRTRHLPLVIVTTQAGPSGAARAAQIGVDGYVTKPFDPETLTEAVHAAMSRRSG